MKVCCYSVHNILSFRLLSKRKIRLQESVNLFVLYRCEMWSLIPKKILKREGVSQRFVSQLIEAYAVHERSVLTMSGWLKIANDAFYLIGSFVVHCMEYQ